MISLLGVSVLLTSIACAGVVAESPEETTAVPQDAGLHMALGMGGTIGYSTMGDFEADRRGREYFSEAYSWERFSYRVPHLGYGWAVDMRFKTSAGYWAALGVGQLRGKGTFQVVDTLYGQNPAPSYELSQTADVSAIPLTITFGTSLPTSSLNLYGGLGADLYFGQMSVSREEGYEEPGYSYTADLDADMSSATLGLHLTGGAEISLMPRLVLYGEGVLRLAKLEGFSGNLTYVFSDSDWNSYYLDEEAYAVMNECPGAPSEEYLSIESERPDEDERWMEVDFSGLFFQVGLRFYIPLGR